jgi:colicin import membrane protein
MRAVLVCVLGLVLAASAWAQAEPASGKADDSAEFQKIESTRAREMQALDAEELACYQHFAVSGCVQEVRSKRRAMLASLRRQEAALHEREFAARGAEQLARSREKTEEKQRQDARLRIDNAEGGQTHPLKAQQEKQAEHAAKAHRSPASSDGDATATPQATGPTPGEQAANRSSFAHKQADAQKKRQDLAKRLADKGGKSATPLPVPE